ncbi:MAG: redoxin domain-containing protein [Halodesulfurarchaeum sp.]
MRRKVVEFEGTDHVERGERAPDFTRPLVTAEFWEDVALSDLLEEGPVLLVFHPMDGAFPTTYVYNELADRSILEGPAQVVGITISTPYDHAGTIEERDLESIRGLYADPKNEVAAEYDVVHDLDGMAGIEEPRLSLFLIEPDRTVSFAWVAAAWPEFPDYDGLEEALEDR